jgi:acyl-CoA synthetase (AMP-forming)/AMP-acid ligase II/thioesterase domain-containing protein/acyl carrier protein
MFLNLFEEWVRRDPGAPAFAAPGRGGLGRGDLAAHVGGFARHLAGTGIRRPDRVVLIVPPGPEMAAANLAVMSAAVAVPMNPESPAHELVERLREIAPRLIVHAGGAAAREAAAALDLRECEILRDLGQPAGLFTWIAGPDASPGGEEAGLTVALPTDIALILQTSGTTSKPKLVPLTHGNLAFSAQALIDSLGLNESDRCLNIMPQFHIGGLWDTVAGPLLSGGSVFFGGAFSCSGFFAGLQEGDPTWTQAVPTMLREVHEAAVQKRGDPPQSGRLRFIRSVSSPLPLALREDLERAFGVPVIEIYGMSETAGVISSNPLPPAARPAGSVGLAAGWEISVLGPEGGVLPAGGIGEVVVRGAGLMPGYLDAPEANAGAFCPEGFRTGDMGYLDGSGYLFLCGRIKDLINRGGEKISPVEVDEALSSHPGVSEAICFPVDHPTLGEDIAAAVVLKDPASGPGARALRAFLAERLSTFKIPQQIHFLEAIPRGPTGKIRRRDVRDLLATKSEAAYVAPRNAFEARLAEIWASVLGRARVGIDDNFSCLGGDSLAAVRLVRAVEKETGRRLPSEVLATITCVREMGEALLALRESSAEAEGDALSMLPDDDRRTMLTVLGGSGVPMSSPGSCVLLLNGEGSLPPFFWCFNSPGKEMPAFAAALGEDQPLYGLYSGGGQLANNDETNGRLADFYAERIMMLCPEGGLRIGGNCRGGGVAIGIAERLKARGRTIHSLCVIDAFDESLFRHPGRMLLMFGRRSAFRQHRRFGWGWPGWKRRFRHLPEVTWISGAHGEFFSPANAPRLGRRVALFLQEKEIAHTAVARLLDSLLIAIHSVRPAFTAYALLSGGRRRPRDLRAGKSRAGV